MTSWHERFGLCEGESSKGPEKDYSVSGNTEDRVFGTFNAIAIIATTYGNGIIPEIQVYKHDRFETDHSNSS